MGTIRLIVCILILTCIQQTIHASDQLPVPFNIIPQPSQVELHHGKGLHFGGLSRLEITGSFEQPVMGDILGLLPQSGTGRTGILSLKLDSAGKTPELEDGYILTISGGNAEIISRGEAGLFYGCQTLEQLLEDARDFNTSVPACKITDSPALSYRAVHIDVKHHLDHMNIYYECIDRLARYKINAIIFEFEDKLGYRRQPLIGGPQSISIDEMAALTRYARKRNIEITPLVQGLGHATFILKHQQYAHLRELPENKWAFCPLHEGTYQVLFDMYRDAMEATPGSRYLHIGGDEIGNIGLCPRCKSTAAKEGVFGLNLYWLKRVCEFVEAHGRIPIFWDDMPLKYAGLIETAGTKSVMGEEEAKTHWIKGESVLNQLADQYPEKCVYMRWNYSLARQPGNIMILDWYKKRGLKSMIATAAHSGPALLFPFDQREGMTSRGIAAIQSFIKLAAEKGIDGMLCTSWDNRSPHMETYWRGFIASAEFSWSPTQRDLDEYDIAYLQREYGVYVKDYVKLYAKLRDASVFWSNAYNPEGSREDVENELQELHNLKHDLPPQGKNTLPVNYRDRLIALPDSHSPGIWSKTYEGRLSAAKKILAEQSGISNELTRLKQESKRNRYHWEVFSAINDFQATAPKMLLALKECDTADKSKLEAGICKVQAEIQAFNLAWKNLKSVYEKTRFIAYPDGFVPDRYYHIASQREDLTWMIQPEEMFHQLVEDWITNNKGQNQ